MNDTNQAMPIACDMTVFTPGKREDHIGEAIRLRKKVLGMEQSADGFRIFFDPSEKEEAIVGFVKDEQRCCRFLSGSEVYRETVSGKERITLSVKTTSEGASAWMGTFFALAQTPAPTQSKRQWLLPSMVAGGLCLACFLPVIGGLLVARGLLPQSWNLSETTYLIAGGFILAGWFLWKNYRKREKATAEASTSKSCGC